MNRLFVQNRSPSSSVDRLKIREQKKGEDNSLIKTGCSESFKKWAEKTYKDCSKTRTITRAKYQKIVETIKGEIRSCAENSKFRFWMKCKGFTLAASSSNLSSSSSSIANKLRGEDVLYVLDKKLNSERKYKKVAVVEDFFDIIYNTHVSKGVRGIKHAGQKRTHRSITKTYAFLPREAVTKFLSLCDVCNKRATTQSIFTVENVQNSDYGESITASEVIDDDPALLKSPTWCDDAISDENHRRTDCPISKETTVTTKSVTNGIFNYADLSRLTSLENIASTVFEDAALKEIDSPIERVTDNNATLMESRRRRKNARTRKIFIDDRYRSNYSFDEHDLAVSVLSTTIGFEKIFYHDVDDDDDDDGRYLDRNNDRLRIEVKPQYSILSKYNKRNWITKRRRTDR